MGFLDSIRARLRGHTGARGSGGGRSSFSGNDTSYWVYAKCGRCGEPLRARINLMNDPSRDDDGVSWVVRKGLSGSGAKLCFQTVEVTLKFDAKKQKVLAQEAVGGEIITIEAYEALKRESSDKQTGTSESVDR